MISLKLEITCSKCQITHSYPFTKGEEWHKVFDNPSVEDNVNAGGVFQQKQYNPETVEITCQQCNSMIEFSL